MQARPALLVMLAVAVALAAWSRNLDLVEAAAPATASRVSAQSPALESAPVPTPVARPTFDEVTNRASQVLEPASYDPFVGVPAAAPAPQQVPVMSATAPAPSPPQAPVPDYRFFGRLNAPDGSTITLLSKQHDVLTVTTGQVLEDGYTVERIELEGVHLHHPKFDTRAIISMPTPTVEPLSMQGQLK